VIVDPPPHPVPEAARVELERLGARWRRLPLPQALRLAPALRALAQRFADECANGTAAAAKIPDLGPAAAYDQLVTLTYDVARHRAAHPGSIPAAPVAPAPAAPSRPLDDLGAALATELAALRRRLDEPAPRDA
jgi:hypothetical protein